MVKISENLKEASFILCKKNDKKPLTEFKGDDWNNKIIDYETANRGLNDGFNIGLVAGSKLKPNPEAQEGENIVLIDTDNDILSKYCDTDMPQTYTEKTTSGGRHYIFRTLNNFDNQEINFNGEHLGELRCLRQYVVISPSQAINRKGELGNYEVLKDLPLAYISDFEIDNLKSNFNCIGNNKTSLRLSKEILEKLTSDKEIYDLFNGLFPVGKRSEAELSLVCKLVARNFDKETIFRIMSNSKIGKWNEECISYRELTYNKAVAFVTTPKKQELQTKQLLTFYSDTDLLDYKPEPQSWLIENQLPKKEIGILAGKRMARKTFIALRQAISLASGKDCFGDKVPEKKKVLIVDEESGVNEIAKRMKLLKSAMGLDKQGLDIQYVSFGGLKLDMRETFKYKEFCEKVKEFQPDLIIVDCLSRVVTFEVDKDNRAISELFTEVVRPITQDIGCTWLFIHHVRKGLNNNTRPEDPLDEVRGGSELVNYCRFVLMTELPRHQKKDESGSEMIVFKVIKMSNSILPEDKVISFTPEKEGLKVEYVGKPEEILSGEQQAANAIKEYLFAEQIKGEFRTQDILNASKKIGFKSSMLKYGLKVLEQEGFLIKVRRGVWKIAAIPQNDYIDFSKSGIKEVLENE